MYVAHKLMPIIPRITNLQIPVRELRRGLETDLQKRQKSLKRIEQRAQQSCSVLCVGR